MQDLEKILLGLSYVRTIPKGALLYKKGEAPRAIYLASKDKKLSGLKPTLLLNSDKHVYGLLEFISGNYAEQNILVESNDMELHEISCEKLKKTLMENKQFQQLVMRLILYNLSRAECCFE